MTAAARETPARYPAAKSRYQTRDRFRLGAGLGCSVTGAVAASRGQAGVRRARYRYRYRCQGQTPTVHGWPGRSEGSNRAYRAG